MKITAIIQARMGSTRLSGKVMKDLYGKTVLAHVIERVKQSELIEDIIIATTDHTKDEVIAEEALRCGVKVFRGSEEDVLSRYYYAARDNNSDVIVRITSDCPLIDSRVVDQIIAYYKYNSYEIVTNASSDLTKRTYRRGLDTEVFSFGMLEQAYHNAKEKYQREHVTPFIYENAQKIYYYKNETDYSKYRWTLDTEEDWDLISRIYGYLYQGEHNFYLKDIIEIMEQHQELYEINKNIEQKKIKG